jgi:hypothetical protein
LKPVRFTIEIIDERLSPNATIIPRNLTGFGEIFNIT